MSLLNRRDALHTLLRERAKMIVVTGLGSPAYDLATCGNEPLDFPLWGAMGGAAMVGLGIALAQPEYRVVVVTGDGEMLMGLGSLATIASQRPTQSTHCRPGQRAIWRNGPAALAYRYPHRSGRRCDWMWVSPCPHHSYGERVRAIARQILAPWTICSSPW